MSLEDILKKYEEEEKTSSSASYAPEPERKGFLDRFGENWMEGGNRIVDTHKNLADSYSSNQSTKDKALRTWNAGASDVMSGIDMIFGSVVYGAIGPDGTEDPDAEPSKFLQGLSSGMEWAGKQYTEGFNSYLDTKLTDKEKEVTQFVGGEGLAEGVGFGAGKLIGSTGKYAGVAGAKTLKVVGKKFGDIKLSRVDIEKSVTDFKGKLQQQSNAFSQIEANPEVMTVKLRELLEKVGNGNTTLSEVRKIAKELKIDETPYIKNLEDMANNKYYKSSSLSKTTLKLAKGITEKTYKKTKTSLEELGYGFNKEKKINNLAVKTLREQGVSQSQIDKTIKGMTDEVKLGKGESATKIEEFLEQSKLKGDLKSIGDYSAYDTATNSRRGDLLKYLEDNALVKKEIIENPVTKDKLYSFRYTDKGLEQLQKINYDSFADTYNGSLKQNHIQNGLAHYPVKQFDNLSTKIDEGKAISYAEISDAVNDLSGDANLSAIDTALFKRVSGDDLNTEKLAYHLKEVDTKYGLKMSDDIEKIKAGDEVALKKVTDQLAELKKNEFITVDRIKNPGRTINFATQTGVTTKLFKTLYQNVEKLSKGDLNTKLGQLKSKIDRTRKNILRKYEGDEITIRAKIKNLDMQHKSQILDIKAKHEGMNAVKAELKTNIINIGKNPEFMGDINKVIKKALLPKNWDSIKTPAELRKKITQINKNIEAEHARGLSRAIKKELRNARITKSNKGAKSQNMTIEQAMQLEQAGKIFGRIKQGDLSVRDLQDLYKEIKEIKSTGRARKIKADTQFAKDVNQTIARIEKDIEPLAGSKNIENKTFSEKAGGYWNSYDNSLLFAPRLIRKIFGKSKEAYDRFIGDVSRAYNQFESFEIKYTDELAKNIGLLFKNNVDDLEAFGQYLYARRRLYDEDGISWIGLDRIMNDKTSSYFKKTDEFVGMDKPKGFSELSDEMWENISKTELAGIMLRETDDSFKRATELWDIYHKLTGKMINKTRLEIDNQFIEPDEFYVGFQALRGPNAEVLAELGTKEFQNSYISPASLKRLTKEIKNGEFIWDYNPVSSLYGNGKNARYYAFMQESHKNMMALYNGLSKELKDLTVDEFNDISKNPEKYSFYSGNKKIELIDSLNDNGTGKVEALVEYIERNSKGDIETTMKQEILDIDDVRIKSNGRGIGSKLSDEGKYRLKKYIDRVGSGGSTMQNQSERMLAQMANHFNRLPLMGSASVILKQPLSLIDAQGMIGPKNLAQAQGDLIKVKGLSKALDDIPSIHNRGGGDFLIKELKNHTPGSGWFDKMSSKYNSYVDVAMAPIKYADQWTYKQIWLGAYRDALIQKGVIKSNQSITSDMIKAVDNEAMTYADDIANRSASTANPLMMPQVYDRAWSKALFGIFTTQLNRLQIMFKDVPDLYKDGRKSQAMYLGASLMVSNIAEYAVTIAVGKGLYAIGATTWEGYDQDWKEMMLSKDLLLRATIEQTFLGSKYTGIINPQFGASPIIGGTTKIAKDIEAILKDPNFENLTKLPTDLLGGKIVEQARKVIINNQ